MLKFKRALIAVAALSAIAAHAAPSVTIGNGGMGGGNGTSVTIGGFTGSASGANGTVSLGRTGVVATQAAKSETFTTTTSQTVDTTVNSVSSFAFVNLANNGAPSFTASSWELDGQLLFTGSVQTTGTQTIQANTSYQVVTPAVTGYDYVTVGDVQTFVAGAAALVNNAVVTEVGIIVGKVGDVTSAVNTYNAALRTDVTEAEADASTEGAALKSAWSSLNSEISSSKPFADSVKLISGLKTRTNAEAETDFAANDVISGYTINYTGSGATKVYSSTSTHYVKDFSGKSILSATGGTNTIDAVTGTVTFN